MNDELMCDCCGATGSLTFVQHDAFDVVVLSPMGTRMIEFEAGEWAFCPVCKELFFTNRLPELVTRVMELQQPTNYDFFHALVMSTYVQLQDCIKGKAA